MTVANLWLWFPFIETSERTQMFVVMHASQHTYAIVCINTVAGQTGKKNSWGLPALLLTEEILHQFLGEWVIFFTLSRGSSPDGAALLAL